MPIRVAQIRELQRQLSATSPVISDEAYAHFGIGNDHIAGAKLVLETVNKTAKQFINRSNKIIAGYQDTHKMTFSQLRQLNEILVEYSQPRCLLTDHQKARLKTLHEKSMVVAQQIQRTYEKHDASVKGEIERLSQQIRDSGVNMINWSSHLDFSCDYWLGFQLRWLLKRETDKLTKQNATPLLTQPDSTGKTLLAYLLESNRAFFDDCLDYCNSGAAIAAIADHHGDTLLHSAARRDDYDQIVALLKRVDDAQFINKRNVKGDTALVLALRKNCFAAAEALVRNNADVKVLSPGGRLPIGMLMGNFEQCEFTLPWRAQKTLCAAEFLLAGCELTPLMRETWVDKLSRRHKHHLSIAVLLRGKRYTVKGSQDATITVARQRHQQNRQSILKEFNDAAGFDFNKALSYISKGEDIAYPFELAVIYLYSHAHRAELQPRLNSVLEQLYRFRDVHSIIALSQVLDINWYECFIQMLRADLDPGNDPSNYDLHFACSVLSQYFAYGLRYQHNHVLDALFEVFIEKQLVTTVSASTTSQEGSCYEEGRKQSLQALEDWLYLLHTLVSDPSFNKAGRRVWKITPTTVGQLREIINSDRQPIRKLAQIKHIIIDKNTTNTNVTCLYTTIREQTIIMTEMYRQELTDYEAVSAAGINTLEEGTCVEMEPLVVSTIRTY